MLSESDEQAIREKATELASVMGTTAEAAANAIRGVAHAYAIQWHSIQWHSISWHVIADADQLETPDASSVAALADEEMAAWREILGSGSV